MKFSILPDSDVFILSSLERSAIEEEKNHYEDARAAAIEALKIVQKKHGWISDPAIKAIAEILNIPTCDLESIATFYSQIYRMPVGRNIIRYCDSVVCYIMGYKDIECFLQKKLNIKCGQTTLDGRFTLLNTCCLGKCDKAPAMMINEDTYSNLTPQLIIELLEQYQ